jgi:hypothetical protein
MENYSIFMNLRHGQTASIKTDKIITVTGRCKETGKTYSIDYPIQGLTDWLTGKERYIQRAMPNVSAADREFLISGISPEGWKQLFR